MSTPPGYTLTARAIHRGGGSVRYRVYGTSCASGQFQSYAPTFQNDSSLPQTYHFAIGNHFIEDGCIEYDLEISFALTCSGIIDAFENNDQCASATPITDGTYLGLNTRRDSSQNYIDLFSFSVADGATLAAEIRFPYINNSLSPDITLRKSTSAFCGTGVWPVLQGTGVIASSFPTFGSGTFGNPIIGWTNQTGAAVDLVLEVSISGNPTTACSFYDLHVSGTTGTGVSFCEPMAPNSSGQPTQLIGVVGVSPGSGIHLEVQQGPPNQLGYFLVGTASSNSTDVFPTSQGRLCLSLSQGNSIGRYNIMGGNLDSVGIFNASGVFSNLVGTSTVGTGFDVPTTLPLTGSPSILPGSTWHFQMWHREPGGSSNFSNGRSFTF